MHRQLRRYEHLADPIRLLPMIWEKEHITPCFIQVFQTREIFELVTILIACDAKASSSYVLARGQYYSWPLDSWLASRNTFRAS